MEIKGINTKGESIVIETEGSKIKSVSKSNHNIKDLLIPGFVDRHSHGGYGYDFMDGSKEKTEKFLKKILSEGCTSIVHTSITAEEDDVERAVKNANYFIEEKPSGIAEMVGIHIEGNYLTEEKKGAHRSDLFKPLTIEEVNKLNKWSKNIKVITYAIEKSTTEVTKKLLNNGIRPSVGHSIATYDDVAKHLKVGLSTCTHLHNAMSGYSHRRENMGIVNAAYNLYKNNLMSELIVDGIHVDREVVKDTYNIIGPKSVIAITDSIRPKGAKDGEYESGGLKVFKKGLYIRTERGEIAGSGQSMIGNFNNLLEFTNCSLDEAVMMTSTNASR